MIWSCFSFLSIFHIFIYLFILLAPLCIFSPYESFYSFQLSYASFVHWVLLCILIFVHPLSFMSQCVCLFVFLCLLMCIFCLLMGFCYCPYFSHYVSFCPLCRPVHPLYLLTSMLLSWFHMSLCANSVFYVSSLSFYASFCHPTCPYVSLADLFTFCVLFVFHAFCLLFVLFHLIVFFCALFCSLSLIFSFKYSN